MSLKPFQNLIVVVAGASRGAGKGIALTLGELGATVYVTARSSGKNYTFSEIPCTIEDTAKEIAAMGGTGIAVRCDYTDDKQVKALFDQIKSEYGRVDVLVNSAWGGEEKKINDQFFWKLTPPEWNVPFWGHYAENWDVMFNRGVRNYLAASCHAALLMTAQNHGVIINISYWDDDKYLGELFYDLAKASMNRLTFGIAEELRKYNIAVIAVAPGFMKTEVVMKAIELNVESIQESFGMPTQTPRFVGETVAALLQDPEILQKSGKVFRVTDLAKNYRVADIDQN